MVATMALIAWLIPDISDCAPCGMCAASHQEPASHIAQLTGLADLWQASQVLLQLAPRKHGPENELSVWCPWTGSSLTGLL